jgi:hypothetical protein
VGWLADILEGTEWHLSIREVLATELEYPGLLDDLNIELWQRRLVKEQMKSEG